MAVELFKLGPKVYYVLGAARERCGYIVEIFVYGESYVGLVLLAYKRE